MLSATTVGAIIAGAAIAGVVLCLLLFRRWMRGPRCQSAARLNGKTVLITGANTGIGKLTAEDLCRRGARVVMLCRSRARGQQAADEIKSALAGVGGVGEILVEELDLSSLASVRKCAKRLLASLAQVDILVNNAGIMMCPLTRTPEGHELQFGTNHLGHFLLTNLLLPLLEASAQNGGQPRVVCVSSSAHGRGQIYWDDPNWERTAYSAIFAYAQSKLANVLFTAELGRRTAGSGITTYSLHPGVIQTELARHFSDTYGVVAALAYRYLIGPFIKRPWDGAQTTLFCCLDESLAGGSPSIE